MRVVSGLSEVGDDAEKGVGIVTGLDIADLHGELVAGHFGFETCLAADPIDERVEPVEDDAEFGEPIPPEIAAGEMCEFVEEEVLGFLGSELGEKRVGDDDGGTQTPANER